MTKDIILREAIQTKIIILRGKKVMLDKDLAMLYGVETKMLKRAVKRNIERFPEDFMFELTEDEFKNLRCQFGASNRGGVRYLSYAFTEHGILMLSSVLNSDRAIKVNIQIMRTFIKMREMIINYQENRQAIKDMKMDYDHRLKAFGRLFGTVLKDIETIYKLLEPPSESSKDEIGFKVN